jgi:hypothetical protein
LLLYDLDTSDGFGALTGILKWLEEGNLRLSPLESFRGLFPGALCSLRTLVASLDLVTGAERRVQFDPHFLWRVEVVVIDPNLFQAFLQGVK